MKCWHLVAAFALGACGLNTSALPSTGRSADDAGVSSADASGNKSIAGSPANWPVRRRPSHLEQDSGSSDTKDAAKPNTGPTTRDRDAQTDPAAGAPTPPGGAANPSGQPSSGGSKPGSQAQPSGSSSGNGQSGQSQNGQSQNGNGQSNNGQNGNGQSSNGQNGNGQNGSGPSSSGGVKDAGTPETAPWPDDDGSPDDDDDDDWSDEDDHSSDGGHGSQQPNSGDAVAVIVDLVLAILDLSLGPVRPAEIEALVSSILVLSLAPADLAAESLVAVLDALEDTRICIDYPERCNPLCTNLESDCSACGNDKDCIERIEEMCRVKLPRTCL